MSEGLPRPVVWAAAVLFAMFALSIAGAGIYFVFQPLSASERFNPELSDVLLPLRVAAGLFAGICVSSLVLALHFKRLGAYSKAQEIFFFVCFGLSVCLGLLTGIPAVASFFV